MGHTQSTSSQPEDQASQLKLSVQPIKDLKQINNDLRHLLNWSLSQIRQIYAPFRRRKGSPILTRSQFLRFIQLSRITSFHIYDILTKKQLINVFQILVILVMGAYTNYIYKIQFLFNIFDFKGRKKLSFSQLILAFKSVVRGYCFLTDKPIPDYQFLEKYGNTMFSKADLNNDQLLEVGDIVGWLESTSAENLQYFKIFQPPLYGKQDYHIFNSFVPYSLQQINTMQIRINKIYKKQKLSDQDYLLLKPILKVRRNQSFNKDTNSKLTKTWYIKQFRQSLSLTKQNHPNLKQSHPNFDKSIILHKSNFLQKQKTTFPPLLSHSTSKYQHSKKRFENIIIIKGRTITKKQVFDLRQYFDGMSQGKKFILIQDFIQNFNQDQYNHMKSVAASLFNFLDKKQNGKIQFLDLVTKLYPNLSSKHISTITNWSDQYNRNFNIDKKVKANRDSEETKKRILPKTCITRLQQLYKFFDTTNKGYVDTEDLQKILGNACTKKQINMLFESSDVDKDGKLTLKQFVHVLLPPDLEIQGLM